MLTVIGMISRGFCESMSGSGYRSDEMHDMARVVIMQKIISIYDNK